MITPPKFKMEMENRCNFLDTNCTDQLDMATNMTCNSIKLYGEAISYLFQENSKLRKNIESNARRIDKKMDI